MKLCFIRPALVSTAVALATLASTHCTFAQSVPALQTGQPARAGQPTTQAAKPLPAVPMISDKHIYLDAKESYGITLANQWKSHPEKPRRGGDGSVKYLYGATLPTLVCTPLQVCSIRLQPGETVNDIHAGDTARWRISLAQSGAGADITTLVIVKPIDAGLVTDMLITTDRRSYTIKLASTQKSWIPVLSFDYPEDVDSALADYKAKQSQQHYATTLPTGQNINALDFNYRISGDRPRWRPLRVYSDGSKTYIQFASTHFSGDAPALVELGNDGGLFRKPSEQIVNYRVIGDRYVIDNVVDRVALISGVGDRQTKVIITHGGRS